MSMYCHTLSTTSNNIYVYVGRKRNALPSAASLAAAHKGKIKNIHSATLNELKEESNPGVVILKLETEALAYDKEQIRKFGRTGKVVRY